MLSAQFHLQKTSMCKKSKTKIANFNLVFKFKEYNGIKPIKVEKFDSILKGGKKTLQKLYSVLVCFFPMIRIRKYTKKYVYFSIQISMKQSRVYF